MGREASWRRRRVKPFAIVGLDRRITVGHRVMLSRLSETLAAGGILAAALFFVLALRTHAGPLFDAAFFTWAIYAICGFAEER